MKHKTNIKSCFERNCLTHLENWRGGHELHSNFTESYNIKGLGIGLYFFSKLLFIVLQRKTTKISFFVLELKTKKITFCVLKRKKRSFWHVFERNILKTNVLKYSQTISSIYSFEPKNECAHPIALNTRSWIWVHLKWAYGIFCIGPNIN